MYLSNLNNWAEKHTCVTTATEDVKCKIDILCSNFKTWRTAAIIGIVIVTKLYHSHIFWTLIQLTFFRVPSTSLLSHSSVAAVFALFVDVLRWYVVASVVNLQIQVTAKLQRNRQQTTMRNQHQQPTELRRIRPQMTLVDQHHQPAELQHNRPQMTLVNQQQITTTKRQPLQQDLIQTIYRSQLQEFWIFWVGRCGYFCHSLEHCLLRFRCTRPMQCVHRTINSTDPHWHCSCAHCWIWWFFTKNSLIVCGRWYVEKFVVPRTA